MGAPSDSTSSGPGSRFARTAGDCFAVRSAPLVPAVPQSKVTCETQHCNYAPIESRVTLTPMLSSHHNIRRPAFWLACTCVLAILFFVLTDPRLGVVKYRDLNPIDAANLTEPGTLLGLAGSSLLLLISLFLCTRKGAPPTKSTSQTSEPAKR